MKKIGIIIITIISLIILSLSTLAVDIECGSTSSTSVCPTDFVCVGGYCEEASPLTVAFTTCAIEPCDGTFCIEDTDTVLESPGLQIIRSGSFPDTINGVPVQYQSYEETSGKKHTLTVGGENLGGIVKNDRLAIAGDTWDVKNYCLKHLLPGFLLLERSNHGEIYTMHRNEIRTIEGIELELTKLIPFEGLLYFSIEGNAAIEIENNGYINMGGDLWQAELAVVYDRFNQPEYYANLKKMTHERSYTLNELSETFHQDKQGSLDSSVLVKGDNAHVLDGNEVIIKDIASVCEPWDIKITEDIVTECPDLTIEDEVGIMAESTLSSVGVELPDEISSECEPSVISGEALTGECDYTPQDDIIQSAGLTVEEGTAKLVAITRIETPAGKQLFLLEDGDRINIGKYLWQVDLSSNFLTKLPEVRFVNRGVDLSECIDEAYNPDTSFFTENEIKITATKPHLTESEKLFNEVLKKEMFLRGVICKNSCLRKQMGEEFVSESCINNPANSEIRSLLPLTCRDFRDTTNVAKVGGELLWPAETLNLIDKITQSRALTSDIICTNGCLRELFGLKSFVDDYCGGSLIERGKNSWESQASTRDKTKDPADNSILMRDPLDPVDPTVGDPVVEDKPECSDGKDNDGDGKIDAKGINADPGCTSLSDNSEKDSRADIHMYAVAIDSITGFFTKVTGMVVSILPGGLN